MVRLIFAVLLLAHWIGTNIALYRTSARCKCRQFVELLTIRHSMLLTYHTYCRLFMVVHRALASRERGWAVGSDRSTAMGSLHRIAQCRPAHAIYCINLLGTEYADRCRNGGRTNRSFDFGLDSSFFIPQVSLKY